MITNTQDLRSLMYRSKAVAPMTAPELRGLLLGAQRFNRGVCVTGVLIYRDGSFLQTIEGPPAGIEAAYKRIVEDCRHTGIETLADVSITRRLFPDWVMALSSELGTSLLLRILRALQERPLTGTSDVQRQMVNHMIAELAPPTAGGAPESRARRTSESLQTRASMSALAPIGDGHRVAV